MPRRFILAKGFAPGRASCNGDHGASGLGVAAHDATGGGWSARRRPSSTGRAGGGGAHGAAGTGTASPAVGQRCQSSAVGAGAAGQRCQSAAVGAGSGAAGCQSSAVGAGAGSGAARFRGS